MRSMKWRAVIADTYRGRKHTRAAASSQGLTLVRFRLNVSTFCRIRWVHNSPPVY